ncbi:hypothetical protein GGR51DRAFT_42262 [Nemania sp. FL0031]|nr:hypothetical protein GGR51DRAFT_42262 [Nemania sp. FL0031]
MSTITPVILEANFSFPTYPISDTDSKQWVQNIREAVREQVIRALVLQGHTRSRTEIIASILPLEDASQLDISTQNPQCPATDLAALPIAPESPSPPSSPSPPPPPSRPSLPSVPSLPSSPIPQPPTAWEAVCHKYPDLPKTPDISIIGLSAQPLVRLPCCRPLEDNPRKKKLFSTKRTSNVKAALVQVTGVQHPLETSCLKCRKGLGLWTGCITAPPPHNNALRGSCANCFYNGTGSKCTFVTPDLPVSLRLLLKQRPGPNPPLVQQQYPGPNSPLVQQQYPDPNPPLVQPFIEFSLDIESLEPYACDTRKFRIRTRDRIKAKVLLQHILSKLPSDLDNITKAYLLRLAFTLRSP